MQSAPRLAVLVLLLSLPMMSAQSNETQSNEIQSDKTQPSEPASAEALKAVEAFNPDDRSVVGAALKPDGQFRLENKPVWEAGLGAGYFSGTDYPGSKDPNVASFGLPFFIYRSKIFRFGDGGVGAVAVEQPRLKIDVSFGGSLNAEPEPDSVRNGMPDLDLLFEFGPRLQYKLYQRSWSKGSTSELTIDTKVRAVVATDFKGIQSQGFVFGAGMDYAQRDIIVDKFDFIINADISFADKRYNDYIYSVPAEFETPTRASYKAKAGYVETSLVLGFALRPHPDWRIFTGFSFNSHAGSANEDSPLFETDFSTRYAIGVVWTALRSKRSIDVYTND